MSGIRRRHVLKIALFTAIQAYLKPLWAFSSARMRKARRIGGTLRTSQVLKLAAILSGEKKLRCSQVLNVAAVLNSQQNLRTSQIVQMVAMRNESQGMRTSQTVMVVAVAI